jgi:hypothetical protein
MDKLPSLIFQSAKLGDREKILAEISTAQQLIAKDTPVRRVYGLSGGVLTALAFCLVKSAKIAPEQFSGAAHALDEMADFLTKAHSGDIHRMKVDPSFGVFSLQPLRSWLAASLKRWSGRDQILLSELPLPFYIICGDEDGRPIFFGHPDETLQFQYHFVHVDPPQDAPILDAVTAGLSTLLSTEPWPVNGHYYHDARPTFTDAGAVIANLEQTDPAPILRTRPFTPLRSWKTNFLTSSFIMHSIHERNQALLADAYLDLRVKHIALQNIAKNLPTDESTQSIARVRHINLPYVGSTEAFTNMRQSVENKAQLLERFRQELNGQFDGYPFDQPANLIYGAGGFSGILAGLTTTRAVDEGFRLSGGAIQEIYGVSAGVLNGFFHAVQIAAIRQPERWLAPARQALLDLENFIAHIQTSHFARVNLNPLNFWKGWANLSPLETFLEKRLSAYTGSLTPEKLTFDDLDLPLTITAAGRDGFTEFFGRTTSHRHMLFGGKQIQVVSAPVIKAILAGWSMNTYIQPAVLDGKTYCDGGGTFYDIGLFVACLDEKLTNQINIHLDEPEGHCYHLPARPNLLRILFDTHNLTFPEERRRMAALTNLLYEYFQLRESITASDLKGNDHPFIPDFRQEWLIQDHYL